MDPRFTSYFYIASPYTHPDTYVRHERFQRVVMFTEGCLKAGIPVFSPIIHSHELVRNRDMPVPVDFWRELNHAMIRPSHGILMYMLDGWRQSVGMQDEEDYALELDKLLIYVSQVPPVEALLERLYGPR